MHSPKIVLTTQFKVNQAFGNYLNYMNREEAKQSNQLSLVEQEASSSISTNEMKRYLHYMNREKALIDKNKMTPADFKELELIAEHNKAFRERLTLMKDATPQKEQLETGMFDLYHDDLSQHQLKKYEKRFDDAQAKGNILFQDVVSFDTKALIEAGIYNPYTNHLSRKPLIEATRKMMRTCYEKEAFDKDTISIGAIHYNTEHFHIHVATIEPNLSSRTLYDEKEQHGLRKKETLMAMKATFANDIFNRTEQLRELGQLRNQLRQEIKTNIMTPKMMHDLQSIKRSLPSDKRKWNAKHLTPSQQKKMYRLIDTVMEHNPHFQRYKALAKQEDAFKRETYGQLPNDQQSFYEGRMYGSNGIYYRLTNSILEELKQSDKDKKNANTIRDKPQQYQQLSQSQHQLKRCIQSMNHELNNMNRHLSRSLSKEKRKAQMEYEREERQRQRMDLEL